MARIITKGLIGQEDVSFGTSTFNRANSTGGVQVLHQISAFAQVSGSSDLATQAANIGSTTLITAGGGFYQVNIGINTTQTATTSSTRPSVIITYTDADSSQVINNTVIGPDSSNSLTNPYAVSVTLNVKAGTNVTYTTSGYLSVGGTPMQYAVHIRVMGPG